MLVALRRRIDGHLQPAQELYDWLIAPFAAELEAAEVDTLLFSMDGSLRSLPVAALHDGEQYLVEKFALGLIPSLNLTDISYRPLQNESVLAMGASQFEALPPLPGVPLELSAIVGDEVSSSKQEGVLRSKRQRRRKKPAISGPVASCSTKILPWQTSWRNAKAIPTRSSILPPTPSSSRAMQKIPTSSSGTNACSSIACGNSTGAIRPWNCWLLSACRTAVGDESAELGFAGLAVRSGIKSVLASLWYVSDAGTLALMDGFYDRLSQEDAATKAEALRQAQLALLRGEAYVRDGAIVLPSGEAPLPQNMQTFGEVDFSNPFYWSGFILVGSPW